MSRPPKYRTDAERADARRAQDRARKRRVRRVIADKPATISEAPCCEDCRHVHVAYGPPRPVSKPGYFSPVSGWVTAKPDRDWIEHQGTGKPCGPRRRKCDQHQQVGKAARQDASQFRVTIRHSNAQSTDGTVITDMIGAGLVSGSGFVREDPDSWNRDAKHDGKQDAVYGEMYMKSGNDEWHASVDGVDIQRMQYMLAGLIALITDAQSRQCSERAA